MTYAIYGLFDSADAKHIRYVGRTVLSVEKRCQQHCRPSSLRTDTYRSRWIRLVLRKGRTVGIVVLDRATSLSESSDMERRYVRELRAAGHRLTNGSEGGDGGINPTDETRQKMRAAHATQELPEAFKAQWGHKQTDAEKAKRAASLRVRVYTPIALANMSAGQKRRAAAETTKRHNRGNIGLKFTDDHKRKISEALRGKPKTEAHKSALRARKAAMREGADALRFDSLPAARAHAESVWAAYPV